MAEWSGHPAYKQVAKKLRSLIQDGTLPVGTQLPSLGELMREYKVSITVVRMALSELRHAGLVVTHQGKGSFVRAVPAEVEADGTDQDSLGAIRAELQAVRKEMSALTDRVARIEKSASKPRHRG